MTFNCFTIEKGQLKNLKDDIYLAGTKWVRGVKEICERNDSFL